MPKARSQPDISEPVFADADAALEILEHGEGVLVLRLTGRWSMAVNAESESAVLGRLDNQPKVQRLTFDTTQLLEWDSGLISFLLKIIAACDTRGLEVDRAGLPEAIMGLLRLARAVPERESARRTGPRSSPIERLGTAALSLHQSTLQAIAFLGEITTASWKLLRGRARVRGSDLVLMIQEVGANALPIVTLISFLVGLILAFVGALQLKQFGAQIYVADLVGLGMAREMGAMMTGVIMAGRTGAAFAAQLGTMVVNEEIDAFKAMGISPIEFLVLPRMIALILMMPLLCLYADLMGILGGAFVGVSLLQLEPLQYYNETRQAISLNDFASGVIKAAVYGVLVAFAGCLRGIQCGHSAAAVGQATTSAVVTAIVLIVVASAILTVIYDVLGF